MMCVKMTCVWRSLDNLMESFHFFHFHIAPGIMLTSPCLSYKLLYLLCHLTSPHKDS